MKLVVVVAMLAVGCGGKTSSRAPTPAQTPAEPKTEEVAVVQATETTSAAVPRGKGLDTPQVHARVESKMTELVERCGELQSDTDRYETMLHLEIDPSGRVDLADARGNHTRLDACVSEVARTWTFDPASVRTIATVPLVIVRP